MNFSRRDDRGWRSPGGTAQLADAARLIDLWIEFHKFLDAANFFHYDINGRRGVVYSNDLR